MGSFESVHLLSLGVKSLKQTKQKRCRERHSSYAYQIFVFLKFFQGWQKNLSHQLKKKLKGNCHCGLKFAFFLYKITALIMSG